MLRAGAELARKPMVRKPESAPPEAERIAKVMARAGLCSRREAEAWIAAGRVAVNGETLKSPARNVLPSDQIVVDGKPMPTRERTRLFRYHKPRGLLTTSRDPQGRPTLFGSLPAGLPRLVSVGRLDFNSEGLLLLTNDGGLKRALELPETGWLRRYRVRANGKVMQADLDRLKEGITVDGISYGPVEAKLDRQQGANVWLTVGLREGKNREVRNVLRSLDLHVNRLIRVSYGPFQLAELKQGAIEEVKTRTLREQLGHRLAREAGVDFDAPVREEERSRSPERSKPKGRRDERERPRRGRRS
jgi:23S rRNA pseudouridine2605 synthase